MGRWWREGPQILADGEDVAIDGGQIAEDLEQLGLSPRQGPTMDNRIL